MRMYKCKGCVSKSSRIINFTFDIDKIDTIYDSTELVNYSVVRMAGNYFYISNEDRIKIEKLLENKFVNNE